MKAGNKLSIAILWVENAQVSAAIKYCALDNPNYVMIDLEFDSKEEADALLAAMGVIWDRIVGTIVSNPQAHIVEMVGSKEY